MPHVSVNCRLVDHTLALLYTPHCEKGMMQLYKDTPEQTSRQDFLTGGGEVGTILRAMDWSKTKLGPMADWPQSLKTALSLVLSSRFELFIWWGPDLIMLYNDAYRQTLAAKHPWAWESRDPRSGVRSGM